MLQVGIPGGPELLIVFILLSIAAFGLLAVLAAGGVLVYLVLQSGSEPNERGRATGSEADRKPLDSSDEATDNTGESVDHSDRSVGNYRGHDQ